MSNKEAVIKLLKLLEYYKKYIAVMLHSLCSALSFRNASSWRDEGKKVLLV